jgi:hypothetical protein
MLRIAAVALILALGVGLAVPPALAQPISTPTDFVYALLPITPQQARQLSELLRTPGATAVDLLDAATVVLDAAPSLPAALLHDLVTAPARDLLLLHALVTDAVDLTVPARGESRGLFRHTIRALYRSAMFTTAADVVRRVTQPTNRTPRLAIVITARTHGLSIEAGDLDLLQRAIDRDSPDLAPLLTRVVERLVQAYGRGAVRLLLTSR